METSTCSVDGLGVSNLEVKWESVDARRFHHQLGYAVRRIQKTAASTTSWQEGRRLAGQLSQWSRSLDGQLGGEKRDPVQRVLVQHVSDASTAVATTQSEADEVVSIATTEPWSQIEDSGKRKPRKRLNRRAKRSARILEEQRTLALLARESALEV